jgi:hypothetical protein
MIRSHFSPEAAAVMGLKVRGGSVGVGFMAPVDVSALIGVFVIITTYLFYPQKKVQSDKSSHVYPFHGYNNRMIRNKPGRPKKALNQVKGESIELRLATPEKLAFKEAAQIAGIPLSIWIRERLRRAAVRELEEADRPIAFLRG